MPEQETLSNHTANQKLRTMLQAAGQSPAQLDLHVAWQVFRDFCKIPMDTDSDGVIVQWGKVHEYHDDKPREYVAFYYSVLRQYNDDSDEYIQLRLQWDFARDATLDQIASGNSWWYFADEDPDLPHGRDNFLVEQTKTDLFKLLTQREPLKTAILLDFT